MDPPLFCWSKDVANQRSTSLPSVDFPSLSPYFFCPEPTKHVGSVCSGGPPYLAYCTIITIITSLVGTAGVLGMRDRIRQEREKGEYCFLEDLNQDLAGNFWISELCIGYFRILPAADGNF